MDVSTIVKTQVSMARLGSASATSGSSSVSDALAPATQRISKQLESTNVKLSAFGQIKGAFAGTQTAAASLSKTAANKTATNADIQKAAQAFVNAYNAATQSVSAAVNGTGKQAGALSSDFRAKLAGNDLAQSLAGGGSASALKQIGITANKNGTLTLDTKALEQALQSNGSQAKQTLSSLAQSVGASATRALESSGNVGSSYRKLSSQSQSLTNQQEALAQQASSIQATLEQQKSTMSYTASIGLASYRSVLG